MTPSSVYFDLALFANYLLSKSTTHQHFDIDIPCSYNHQGLPRRQGCPLWSLPQTYPFARPCPAPSSFQLPKRKPTGRETSEIWGESSNCRYHAMLFKDTSSQNELADPNCSQGQDRSGLSCVSRRCFCLQKIMNMPDIDLSNSRLAKSIIAINYLYQ